MTHVSGKAKVPRNFCGCFFFEGSHFGGGCKEGQKENLICGAPLKRHTHMVVKNAR